MKSHVPLLAFLTLAASAHAADELSFSRDIAPILMQRCQACHGPKKAKGGYRVDTFNLIKRSGKSDFPALTPGDPDQSELYNLLVETSDDDRMPKDADPMPKIEIDRIAKWIRDGASFDGPNHDTALIEMVPAIEHPPAPDQYPAPMPIAAMDLSPDGKQLAVGAHHEVILWDPDSARIIRRMGNAPRRLFQVTFAPDGKTLMAVGGEAGMTGEGRLFEVSTGKLLRVFGPRDDTLLCAAWHPNGKHIALGGADGQIRIHETDTGKETLRYAGHADWITALDFSRDGQWLATASRDKTARVIHPENGKVRSIYRNHQDQVFNVAFNAAGDRVYSGGADQRVHEWMAQDAKRAADFGKLNREPIRLIVTDDTLWIACGDGKAYRYALKDRSRQRTYETDTDWLFGLARHGNQLILGGPDGKIRQWVGDADKPKTFTVLPGLR